METVEDTRRRSSIPRISAQPATKEKTTTMPSSMPWKVGGRTEVRNF